MKKLILFISLFVSTSSFAMKHHPVGQVEYNATGAAAPPIVQGNPMNGSMGDFNALLGGSRGGPSLSSTLGAQEARVIQYAQSMQTLPASFVLPTIQAPQIVAPSAAVSFQRAMQALPSKHIDLATIPNPDEASLPYHLQSTGIFREDLLNTYQNLYKIQPHYGKQAEAKDLGIESVLVADEAYSHGDVDQGQFFSATARGFLDIAIGIDPLTGSIRGAYELVTGRNMITGEQLSNLERGISAIRCIPLGGGVIIGGGEAIIVGLGRLTRFVRVIRSDVEMIRTAVRFSQFIQDGARGRTVQTFREIAPQQMSPPALIARARVLEGSTVYRIGTRGENYTGNTAQYWSFENPVNNPTYGARYGMPQENFAGADFVETATVRPNIEFITRPAPPVGANPGGGIEVVVPVGGTIPGGHFSL